MHEQEQLNNSLKIFAKSSFIVFIGVVISKIFTYLYKMITARTFGEETYGLFSLALMVFGIFAAFSSLGLQSGLVRYIPFYRGGDEKDKIRYIFRFSVIVVLLISIVSGALLFLSSNFISISIFHNQGLIIFLKWFALFIPLLLLSGTFHAVIRAYEKISAYSFVGNILLTTTQFLFLVILISIGLKDEAIIFSYNLGFLIMFGASFLVVKYKIPEVFKSYKIDKKTRIKTIKGIFSYSWPIMFFGLVLSIFSWIDSFTIGYFKTASDVGIYNAAIPIAILLEIFPSLFMILFLPLITKEYAKENFKLIKQLSKQIAKWILIFNLPFATIMILFPGAIINILFGSNFLPAENALRLLSIGILFYSLFIVSENLLSVSGKSKRILFNIIIAATLNITLNIILVPLYGINGAAFSTMISYILWSIISFVGAKKHTSIIPLKRNMIKVILAAVISSSILLILKNFMPVSPTSLILQGVFFLLLYSLLILFTGCLDKNDFVIIKAIKNKIIHKR